MRGKNGCAGRVKIAGLVAGAALAALLVSASLASAASAPTIVRESVSNVGPTDATLEAEIATGGLETSYEFHLLERWRCEDASPPCLPPIRAFQLPGGQLPGSAAAETVSLDLSAAGVTLSPGHDYYEYWVTAANADGAAEAPPQRFATPPEEGAEPPPETEEVVVEPPSEGEVVGEPVPEAEGGGGESPPGTEEVWEPVPEPGEGGEPLPEPGEGGEPPPETGEGVEPLPGESAYPLSQAISGTALQSPAATRVTEPSAAARPHHRKRHRHRHRRRAHRAARH